MQENSWSSRAARCCGLRRVRRLSRGDERVRGGRPVHPARSSAGKRGWFADKVALVWKVADKLRGTFKQHEYGSVILPLLVLRRMDAVLAPTKDVVVAKGGGHERGLHQQGAGLG